MSRIVTPISRADLHLLPNWVDVHNKTRAGLNHQLHFVVPQAIESEAHDAKANLGVSFESITIHTLDTEPMGGWPFAPNSHFWYCATFMARDNPNIPWQLVELDCLPIRQSAYDAIASKHTSAGTPYFGNVSKTPWRVTDESAGNFGKITKSLYGDGDLMMSGCGVYPGNITTRPNSVGLVADLMKGQDSTEVPWDMHLRAAMQADGMGHTELIGNYWNTCNYRIENGQIVCDSRETHEIFDKNPKWELRKCGGIVHPDAVMIHGCKDESLYRLIMDDAIPETFSRVAPIQASAPQQALAPAAAPVQDDRLDRLEKMMMALMEQRIPTTSVAPNGLQGEPATASPSAHETKVTPDSLTPLEKVAEIVTGQKGVRINDLAKQVGMKADKLVPLIQGSADFIYKAPGWVKRKEAA